MLNGSGCMLNFALQMKPSQCLTLLFVTLILSGCSPEWLLKQAIKKDPTLLKTKTITVMDTVVTEPIVVKDTVIISQVDTVEIVKDKFRVKIMRSYDTLIIDGGCNADTIFRTIEVPIERVVYQERERWYQKVYRWSFIAWLCLVFVFFLNWLTKIK